VPDIRLGEDGGSLHFLSFAVTPASSDGYLFLKWDVSVCWWEIVRRGWCVVLLSLVSAILILVSSVLLALVPILLAIALVISILLILSLPLSIEQLHLVDLDLDVGSFLTAIAVFPFSGRELSDDSDLAAFLAILADYFSILPESREREPMGLLLPIVKLVHRHPERRPCRPILRIPKLWICAEISDEGNAIQHFHSPL
jgi:hypothetical protein